MSFIVLKTPILLFISLEISLPLPQPQPLQTKTKSKKINSGSALFKNSELA